MFVPHPVGSTDCGSYGHAPFQAAVAIQRRTRNSSAGMTKNVPAQCTGMIQGMYVDYIGTVRNRVAINTTVGRVPAVPSDFTGTTPNRVALFSSQPALTVGSTMLLLLKKNGFTVSGCCFCGVDALSTAVCLFFKPRGHQATVCCRPGLLCSTGDFFGRFNLLTVEKKTRPWTRLLTR